MRTFDPEQLHIRDMHQLMLGAVSPRPIAFAGTLDADGRPNLAPFSWFNVFSTRPPVLAFSPARRGRDNTTKHTYENAKATREVVINIVNYELMQQMILTSTEYDAGVNEYEKAGLTALSSEKVKPFRVAEAPVQFECKVRDIIEFGDRGAAGNLILCEVVYVHAHDTIFGDDDRIDPRKIDTVGRLNGNWYSRAASGLMQAANPTGKTNVGYDGLPDAVKNSTVLSANDITQLARIPEYPSEQALEAFTDEHNDLKALIDQQPPETVHLKAKEFITAEQPEMALTLLAAALR